MLQKVRKQGIRFWDERTFWHEIIYKSLIPTFGSLHSVGLPKVGIKGGVYFMERNGTEVV